MPHPAGAPAILWELKEYKRAQGQLFHGPYASVEEFKRAHLDMMKIVVPDDDDEMDTMDILLPGHQEWIAINEIESFFHFKVSRYEKRVESNVEHVLLREGSKLSHLLRAIEERFIIEPNSFDIKLRSGQYDVMDLSDENADLPVGDSAFIVHSKLLQGKIKQGKQSIEYEPKSRISTLEDLRSRKRKERDNNFRNYRAYGDDDDDDDDDAYVPPPAAASRSMRHFNQAFDSGAIKPFVEKIEDGLVSVGFSMSMSLPEARVYFEELFTPSAHDKLDKQIAQDKAVERRNKRGGRV